VAQAGLQLDELVEQLKAHARLRAPGLTRAIRPARHAWRGFWRQLGVRNRR
jgi:hypothetical protein